MNNEKTIEIAELLSQLTPENMARFCCMLREVEEAISAGKSNSERHEIIERHMRECLN